jgi:hypothetical protein
MNMWTHLPLGELHRTTNYGCAGGVCEGRYANIHHAQLRRALEQIERDIVELKKDDPTMYYDGDFAELLDTRRRLTERLKGPIA